MLTIHGTDPETPSPDAAPWTEDPDAVFRFGLEKLAWGKSLGEIELQAHERGVSRFIYAQVQPRLEVIETAEKLAAMRYIDWIRMVSLDLFKGGLASVALVLVLIPLSLYLVVRLALWVGPAQWMQLLASQVAPLLVPLAWVIGWPLFHVQRWVWRRRASGQLARSAVASASGRVL